MDLRTFVRGVSHGIWGCPSCIVTTAYRSVRAGESDNPPMCAACNTAMVLTSHIDAYEPQQAPGGRGSGRGGY